MDRPYAQLDIEALESLLEYEKQTVDSLNSMASELSLRKTRRARRLLMRVLERLDDLDDGTGTDEDAERFGAGMDSQRAQGPTPQAVTTWGTDDSVEIAKIGESANGAPDPTAKPHRSTMEPQVPDGKVRGAENGASSAPIESKVGLRAASFDTPTAASIGPTVAERVAFDPTRWEIASADVDALEPAGSEEHFELHLAACEWDMDPAILINGPADIQARVHWQDVLEPFEHQIQNLITFCRRAPVALLADDVGLGKTISAGLILSELRVRGKVNRTLIVVPKAVLLDQWKGELYERFAIDSTTARGAQLDVALRDRSIDVVITTYDSARNRLSRIEDGAFDMLILDEAHKLRNLHGVSNPPRTAVEFQRVLRERMFRYVLMLTATPIQNRLWDLYSLVDLLTAAKGHENPLGGPDAFFHDYIADTRSSARQLEPRSKVKFRRILGEYMVRTRRADAKLVFPPRRLRVLPCDGTPGESALFSLVGEVIGGLNGLQQSSVAQALMSSPRALATQLQNMADRGSVSVKDATRAAAIASQIEQTSKERVLVQLVAQLQSEGPDWRLVIFTGRKETQDAIGEVLGRTLDPRQVGFIRGGRHSENQRAIAGYVSDPPTVSVLISTDAGTEGLNLQAGNVLVNFDLPWNPMVLEQRIGRVQRLGSKHAEVVILNLVLKGSVEEKVVARLVEKLAVIADSIGDIEGILDGMDSGGGDEEPLVRKINELVVGSLRGRDVEASLRSIQASIDRAKEIYEREKAAVEENLGRLDSMHDEGPPRPTLTPVEPRLDTKTFVTRALEAGEGTLEYAEHGRLVYRRRGYAPEEVVFERPGSRGWVAPAIAGGPRVSVYLPGQPAFEKLGEIWRRRAQHAVYDHRSIDEGLCADAARTWLAKFGRDLEFHSIVINGTGSSFQGKVVVRAAVSVAHDKYEKLIEVAIEPPGIEAPPSGDGVGIIDEPIDLAADVVQGEMLEVAVLQGIEIDTDIGNFATFYVDRMDEEVERSGGDPALEQLHRDSLTPRVSTKVVGATGALQNLVNVQARFDFDKQEYLQELRIAPALGRVVRAPEPRQCEESGRVLPSTCIGECEVTGKSVRRSLLETSLCSGRQALSSLFDCCEVTGVRLLPDELGRSSYSGKVADLRLLQDSATSGRSGLAEEMVRCEITGAVVLLDEILKSEVSGRQFRADEGARGGAADLLGHRSEFVECAASGKRILPQEAVTSDVSGRTFDRSIAVKSERSGRLGGPDEQATCRATKRTLLIDEVEECMVTHELVDRELLAPSSISGTRCRKDILQKCERSGVAGLPSELERSAVSNLLVDKRLLKASEMSGQLALADELEPCSVTGDLLLPSELAESAVSGRRVRPSLLVECAVSGRMAMKTEMVEDALDLGSWIIESEARTSDVSGRASRPENVTRCQWDGRLRLADEYEVCKWTGLHVGSSALSEAGHLAAFDVSSSSAVEEEDGVMRFAERLDFSPPLRVPELGAVRALTAVTRVTAPTGRLVTVSGERSRLLGLSQDRVQFVLDSEERPLGRGHIQPRG
ncbi:DEAD/DEAH box helicase [Engelhardtia mirabilis]|uniref:RNA polymerase-associated protein RapA n=1 Tax=Engelhardtia mirabilis TaxID=2528011 RepID=A0A518BH93_9BACT|nr:RNA polymerase-associated protein RapA [Planctomycetes bacterium Pla133]QDV00650.1 RNA polymerase-associated protein RapA [Planctomycetes bacterium Pla86]